MNAMLRAMYEAPVLTNEAIEVHLSYLRTGFETMQAAMQALRARIETVNTSLTEKIDKANEQRAAGDAVLSVKMDRLTEKVLEIQGHQKALLWVISLATIIAASVSIARTLNWT